MKVGPIRLGIVALGLAIVGLGGAIADEPASREPADPVAAIYYRFAVVEYCNFLTPDVAAGFAVDRNRVVAAAAIDEDQHRARRIAGWTAADLEWSNRGLGGFRRWCETEGAAAVEGFLEAAP